MPLPPLHGHRALGDRLARAARNGTLSQSLLLHGPAGIGKERFALWLGQMLLCAQPGEAAPCGGCQHCRMALRLEHPDLHWFFPLPRPEGAAAERLRDRLEEARAAELAVRRAEPLHQPRFDRPASYFLASIQALQALAAVRPAMGAHKVFVVGDADRMVPQESSPEAANAFLKLLEEPPSQTTLILTSSQPGALLPTIRSRVLPVRMLPLGGDDVAAFLVAVAGLEPADARVAAAAAGGSIGRAVQRLPSGDGVSAWSGRRELARSWLEAALVSSAVPRLAVAHAQSSAGARSELPQQLESLTEWLRDLLAVASGAADSVIHPDGAALLQRAVDTHGIPPAAVAAAIDLVDEARMHANGNVNPQLILANLLASMQAKLTGARA
jgi:DNA polymerase III subunit delta'